MKEGQCFQEWEEWRKWLQHVVVDSQRNQGYVLFSKKTKVNPYEMIGLVFILWKQFLNHGLKHIITYLLFIEKKIAIRDIYEPNEN